MSRPVCDCGWGGGGAHELSCGRQPTDDDLEREAQRADDRDYWENENNRGATQ